MRILVLDEREGLWRQALRLDGSEVYGLAAADGQALVYSIDHFSKHGFAQPIPGCEAECNDRDCGEDG